MATKKEKEDLRLVLKRIDNKWEAIAFIWAYRQKEIKGWIITIQSGIILFLLLYYTSLPSLIGNWVSKLFK